MDMRKELYEELQQNIKDTYEQGVTLDEAEKLAAKFLYAQMEVSAQLKTAQLDARMRKSGVKAVRAAVYLDGATKGDKKPSDVLLQALVDRDEMVANEQKAYDTAEVEANELENYLVVFREAHIYFRGISKGRFE